MKGTVSKPVFGHIHLASGPLQEPMATRQVAKSSHELTVVLQESTLGLGPRRAMRRSSLRATGQAPARPQAESAEVKVITLPATWLQAMRPKRLPACRQAPLLLGERPPKPEAETLAAVDGGAEVEVVGLQRHALQRL